MMSYTGQKEAESSEETVYMRGYNTGLRNGIYRQRLRQHRYAWGKLLLCIIIGTFTSHLLWAIIAAYVV